MMADADGNTVLVEHGADIMRVHAIDVERDDTEPALPARDRAGARLPALWCRPVGQGGCGMPRPGRGATAQGVAAIFCQAGQVSGRLDEHPPHTGGLSLDGPSRA